MISGRGLFRQLMLEVELATKEVDASGVSLWDLVFFPGGSFRIRTHKNTSCSRQKTGGSTWKR